MSASDRRSHGRLDRAYPPAESECSLDERVDDVLSLRAQVDRVRRQMGALEGAAVGVNGDVDLLYLEEKAQALSAAATSVARDARLIFERSGQKRWLGHSLEDRPRGMSR